MGGRAADWFSFDLPVDAAGPLVLVVTYSTDERAGPLRRRRSSSTGTVFRIRLVRKR
jgi:hypothetical protein